MATGEPAARMKRGGALAWAGRANAAAATAAAPRAAPAHAGARTNRVVLKAADGPRTRDLKLGKLALYQLSYHRVGAHSKACSGIAPGRRRAESGPAGAAGD